MTLYLFNRLIRVATYLRRSGNKTIRVKSFQRKLNPLLNMPPGKLKLNKPGGLMGKEVAIDTDGTLREALTELSDLPFVPKLIASKGDKVLIERPLITRDFFYRSAVNEALVQLHARGYISKNMDVAMSGQGYALVLDPIKASKKQVKEQYESLGFYSKYKDPSEPDWDPFMDDRLTSLPVVDPEDLSDLPKLDLSNNRFINPLDITLAKETVENISIGQDEIAIKLSSKGEISFTVNQSHNIESSYISGDPVQIALKIRSNINNLIKKQKENTLLWCYPSDSGYKRKKQLYEAYGFNVKSHYGNTLYGVVDSKGRVTTKGISQEYLAQISDLLSRANYSKEAKQSLSIRDLFKWE